MRLNAAYRLNAARFTVQISCEIKGVPTIFTEYVNAPSEKDAWAKAKFQASERISEKQNIDSHKAREIVQHSKHLAIADGFVSMSISRKIQHRNIS